MGMTSLCDMFSLADIGNADRSRTTKGSNAKNGAVGLTFSRPSTKSTIMAMLSLFSSGPKVNENKVLGRGHHCHIKGDEARDPTPDSN